MENTEGFEGKLMTPQELADKSPGRETAGSRNAPGVTNPVASSNQTRSIKEMTMDEKLYTPAEVAERLKVSKALVYQMLKNGTIAAVRFGKIVRVRPQDLQRFIRANAEAERDLQPEDETRAGELGLNPKPDF
jgi:excisionase family DNA binding protein